MAHTAAERKRMAKFRPKYVLEEIKAKEDVGNAALKTGAQVLVGVFGGGILSAALGKPSFLIGLTLAGIGNYKDVSWMAPLGIGMMASSHIVSDKPVQTISGTSRIDWKEEAGKAKERLTNLKDSFLSKSYIGKIFQKNPAESKNKATQRAIDSGEDNPENVNGLSDTPVNDAAFADIEKELIASAIAFQKKQQSEKQVSGTEPELMGLQEEVDFSKL